MPSTATLQQEESPVTVRETGQGRTGEKRWKYAEWEIKWVTITGKHDSIINVQQAGGQ